MDIGKAKKTETIRIYNCSNQLVQLQVRPPGSDFYRNEQQVRIDPGKNALLPKTHLIQEQVDNLQKRKMIRIVFDSEEHTTVTP